MVEIKKCFKLFLNVLVWRLSVEKIFLFFVLDFRVLSLIISWHKYVFQLLLSSMLHFCYLSYWNA